MRPIISTVALALFSIGSTGCEGPNPNLEATAASVQIGTGADAFESVDDGAVLSPTSGGQGGVHIWGSLRFDGFEVRGGPSIGLVAMSVEIGIDHPEGPVALLGPMDASVSAATGEFVGGTVTIRVNPEETPFLYPPGFSSEGEYPDDDEWAAANEYMQERMNQGLTMWARAEDADGNVLEDERMVMIQGLWVESFNDN